LHRLLDAKGTGVNCVLPWKVVSMLKKSDPLAEDQRREVFAALVAAQDGGRSVAESRREVAARFELSVQQLSLIESEGMDNDWPPL
jgi:hypothetical protein